MKPEIETVLDARATLGEGALWDADSQRLLWVDILGKRVGLFDPQTRVNSMLQLDTFVGTVVPTTGGALMVAVREGFARLNRTTGLLSTVERPQGHDPSVVRFNDGKCDPFGRFWAGTMALDEGPGRGALYCLNPDGRIRRMLERVSISNGIAWSLDRRRMYYIDTPTRSVVVFDYDFETGAISNQRLAFEIPEKLGYPDGMTIDAEGMLWIALWDGWAVSRWHPGSGQLLATISLPVSRVTSCSFGGPGLTTLYITSARVGLSSAELEQQPLAGGLFASPTETSGLRAFTYGD